MQLRTRDLCSTSNCNNNNNSTNEWKTEEQLHGDAAPPMLSWKQVPVDLREPGILTGYRLSYQPWTYYLKSLLWIHNETGNIWTHLLSPVSLSLIVLTMSHHIDFATDQAAHGLLVFSVGVSILFLLSTLAHLFRSRSPEANFVLFSLDYYGVGIVGYVMGIMLYHSSGTDRFYHTVGPQFRSVIMLSGLCGTTGMIAARTLFNNSNIKRKVIAVVSLALCVLVGQLPVFYRFYDCTTYDDNLCYKKNISYHVSAQIFALLCPFLFSLHLPEKAFPGKFDIFGTGHQLFHVSSSISIQLELYAAYLDLKTLPRDVLNLAQPSAFLIWYSFFIYLTATAIVLLVFFAYKFYHTSNKSDL